MNQWVMPSKYMRKTQVPKGIWNLQNGEKYILWGKRQTDTHTQKERSLFLDIVIYIYVYIYSPSGFWIGF